MNPLRQWHLEKNHLKKPEDGSIERSHLLFNGGNLYIPGHMERDFLKKYSEELTKGSKLYYVEVRPKIFKYMIDVDITDTKYWSNEEIISICKFIDKIVAEFYEDAIAICCIASAKKKQDLIHTGIHMIYPKIFINSDNAILIRSAILQKLNGLIWSKDDTSLGFHKTEKLWEDTLDEVIYTKNGYRMVGSDKILDKKTMEPENRVYMPFLVLMNNEPNPQYLQRLCNNYENLLLETSIRNVPQLYTVIDNVGMVPKLPRWLSTSIKIPSVTGRKYNLPVFGALSVEKDIIENFIKKNIKEYSNIHELVQEVLRTPGGKLLVKVNASVKYCMNLGRSHKSCKIYFMIYADSIRSYLVQKCLCPCDTVKDRKNGLCRDFTSETYILPVEYDAILFPRNNLKKYIKSLNADSITDSQNVPETSKNVPETSKNVPQKILQNIPTPPGRKKIKSGAFVSGMTSKKAQEENDLKQCGLRLGEALKRKYKK